MDVILHVEVKQVLFPKIFQYYCRHHSLENFFYLQNFVLFLFYFFFFWYQKEKEEKNKSYFEIMY